MSMPQPKGLSFGAEIEGIAPPEDQAKISWSLFADAVARKEVFGGEVRVRVGTGEGMKPALAKIMGNFWFPGLGEQEITLQNIVLVLFDLLKKGQWREKIEASKSLLYLYRTFDRDFRNPLEDIVLPQVEMCEDENWQVREATVRNLVGYGVWSLEVVGALVRRLADGREEVRTAAMKSLNALGVTSKDALRAVLMQLRMLPSHGEGGAKQDWLDIQLYRLRTQRQTSIATNNDWIWRWLRHVDGKCYGTPVDRPASSLITLVPPPVFNDVEVPEFLKKAKERMEKKYGSVFMRRGGLFEGRRERLVGWEVGSERGR